MRTITSAFGLFVAHLHANLQRALEFKTSLFGQMGGMALTNVMWVIFFAGYFERFQLPGWGRTDVVMLWALAAGAYGLAGMVAGNFMRVASMISRGELDFYLALPRPPLFHLLVSEMRLVSPGDFLFALGSFAWLGDPTPARCGLFLLGIVCGAAVLVSFCVMAGSLAFWFGNAELASDQAFMAVTNFSTYPLRIFEGVGRLLVFTVLPSAYITGLPVELMAQPHLSTGALLVAVTLIFIVTARVIFYEGLKRYTSGNAVWMRE